MVKYFISVLFLLMFVVFSNAQYKVTGTVKKNKEPLKGAIISLTKDSIEIEHLMTDETGKFSLILSLNKEYTIYVKKDGYITKKLFFSLLGISAERAKQPFGGQDIVINLFEFPSDKSLSSQLNVLLSEPLAKFYYDNRIQDIDFDRKYSQAKNIDLQKVYELQKSLDEIQANPAYSEARGMIEKLMGENLYKEAKISTLQKDKEIKDLELKNKEIENAKKASELSLLSKERELQENKIQRQVLESDKKTQELKILNQSKILQGISLNSQKEEISKQKQMNNIFILGLLIVIVFAGFVFRSLRIRNKQNKIIVAQKIIVEEKQKEILDSIHYAKRIQQSLLPTEKYIQKKLNDLKR